MPSASAAPAQAADFATANTAPENLRHAAVRGAALTTFGQGVKFALRFGSTAVLARLLTPEDYGLVAMTAVVAGFVGLFKDAGLDTATIQRADITQEQISTLYWINIALGTAIALLLVCVSPLVAKFYGDARLTAITCALATSFIFGGATVQHQAILRRQMRFDLLARIEITSVTIGVVVAIAMASMGFRYWSLVGLTLGTSLTNAVQVHFAARWRPGPPRRKTGVREMIRFGTDILAFNVLNYFARQGDNLLIGWFWGPTALGFYERAYSLLLLPILQINTPLGSVALPALSRSLSDPAKYARFFLGALQMVAGFTVPIVFAIAIFADQVVWLWLGPAWMASADLFRLLAVGALLSALYNPIGWMLMSSGDTRRFIKFGLIHAAVLMTSFLVGLPYGPRGVAASFSIFASIMFVPIWWYALRGKPIRLKEVLGSFIPPVLSGAPAVAGALGIMHFGAPHASIVVTTLVAAVCFVLVYAGLLLFAFKKRHFYQRLWQDLRSPKDARTPPIAEAVGN